MFLHEKNNAHIDIKTQKHTPNISHVQYPANHPFHSRQNDKNKHRESSFKQVAEQQKNNRIIVEIMNNVFAPIRLIIKRLKTQSAICFAGKPTGVMRNI
jgi:hypothetical protein